MAEDIALLDKIFRVPPEKPDARMLFLGGCGIITLFRGCNILWGSQPQADLFYILGDFFIAFWGWMWIFIGIFVVIVALTGHRFLILDLTVAYLLLCVWWLWSLIYLLSAIFVNNDRLPDFLAAAILGVTGLVLTAGVVLTIRKTQLLTINEALKHRINELDSNILKLVEAANKSQALKQRLDDDEL